MQQYVTTIKDANHELVSLARIAALELELPFLDRNKLSLIKLIKEVNSVLVYEKNGLAIHSQNGVHRFHLNLAGLRILNLERGQSDNMVEAMALTPGKSVLDCTLGLASDAIVASYVVGESGYVHGCEKSNFLHYVTKNGLTYHNSGHTAIDKAMRRITTTYGDYGCFLKKLAPKKYDVIYFDPMFQKPRYKSSALKPLREIVCHNAITDAIINLALDKTVERVVVKLERHYCGNIAFDEIFGSKNSAVSYGIIYGGEACINKI